MSLLLLFAGSDAGVVVEIKASSRQAFYVDYRDKRKPVEYRDKRKPVEYRDKREKADES